MDWIVFGDDWGGHPSTTQHLVLNLPEADRVIWVNSIGMRGPSVSLSDIRRMFSKFKDMVAPRGAEKHVRKSLYKPRPKVVSVLQPRILPWHLNKFAVSWNKRVLQSALTFECRRLGVETATLLSATPVVSNYLDAVPHSNFIYLRLDVYEKYPGCDPELVRISEAHSYHSADSICVTAKALYPDDRYKDKVVYLPQGVDLANFSQVSLTPPQEKVLGFLGPCLNG